MLSDGRGGGCLVYRKGQFGLIRGESGKGERCGRAGERRDEAEKIRKMKNR